MRERAVYVCVVYATGECGGSTAGGGGGGEIRGGDSDGDKVPSAGGKGWCGKLAWRAVNSILPKKEEFPYTFRIVSEITESNGSSSMATVCGASLALMDAGVPIKKPVAGIAMGLIKEGADYSVLSDILGDEDHLGDMDFKVAGTEDGITSLQMDIKITGITFEIMDKALSQAKDGRIHILGEMNKALKTSRKDLSKHTPKMEKVTVDKKDIAAIIGKGGVTIREIVELSGAKVDISDDGIVTIAAPDEASRRRKKLPRMVG